MQRLGLSASDLRAYHETLRGSHVTRIRVWICNMEGAVLAPLSERIQVIDGSVTVDGSSDVTRALSLTLLDPTYSLDFDTDSPDDGALYLDRMLKVSYDVFVDSLDEWVEVPIFLGPITSLSRSTDTVQIEAQGKETLALDEPYTPLTLKRGTKKTTVMRQVLASTGETEFAIPDLAPRIPRTYTLKGRNFGSPKKGQAGFGQLERVEVRNYKAPGIPWTYATNLARSLNRQLYYSGDGVATLRSLPSSPVYTFRSGDGGDVLTPLTVSYSSEFRNIVVVTGRKPKDKKKPAPRAVAWAPATHPLSARRLGRNGKPRRLVERVTDDSVRTKKEAQARADALLKDRLLQAVEVSFDTLPIPHLDPGDLVRVSTSEGTYTFRLWQYTIPLGGGVMNVGYNRRRPIRKGRIRR